MRRVLPSIAVVAPALAAACFGAGEIVVPPAFDDASTADVSAAEASSDGTSSTQGGDAAGDAESLSDAARTGDVLSSDGAATDALPPGPVTVVVTTVNGPEQGVSVVFSNPDGSYVATGSTDGSGKATQTLAAGGMVTALFGQTEALVTIAGVASGDVISLLDPTVQPPAGSWDLTSITTSTAPSGSNYSVLNGPCTNNNKGLALPFAGTPAFTDCAWQGPLPVMLQAFHGTNGDNTLAPLAWFTFSKANALLPDGGVLDVALGQSWTETSTVAINLSNVPAGFDPTYVQHYEYSDGYPFSPYSGFNVQPVVVDDPDAGTASVTFPTYPGLPDFVQSAAPFYMAGGSRTTIAMRNDSIPSTVSLDLSQYLPAILAGGVDGVSSPGRPIVTWTPLASLAAADGTYVNVSWNYPNQSWTFVIPPGATSLQAPVLPSSASSWVPTATSGFGFTITTVDTDGVDGYSAFRAMGTRLFSQDTDAPPLPMAGLYRGTTFSNQ
jgi:hypothetical protein